MKYLYAYRNMAIPSVVITLFLCFEFWRAGPSFIIVYLLWVKIASSAVIMGYLLLFRSSILFFFYNLGMSRLSFFISMFIIDMTVFSMALICTAIIK